MSAFNLILKKGKHLNVYNIGTNEKIKIKHLVSKLSKLFERKIILKKVPSRKGSTIIRIPNISKIKKLGFKQKYRLTQGLQEILLIKNYK